MRTRTILWLALLATAMIVGAVWTPIAGAQAVYGSILGTVTDPQGAAVANAKVTVLNQAKGTSDTVTTNESGNYSVLHLIPDLYTVRVEAPGFKVSEQKGVIVSVDTGSRVDLQFQVGGASETVEVTGEAPQLKTDRSDVATIFNDKAVVELPILNRNFTTFELLSPGTQKLVGWSHASTENPQGGQQIFVNGQHFSGTAFELDGTDNQDPILGIIVINPNLDSVTETKITLQNYDAEFGKAVAGVVTAQTKSGSNQFHGSGFFFNRGQAGAALDPFNQSKQLPNETWKQFGGSIGGPIIKDKLFFFGDYQGTRRSTGRTLTKNVPTQLVRDTCLAPGSDTCDLSQYLEFGQVYDPREADGERTAFAGNLIPTNILSQAAINILSALPAPNTGDPDATKGNFVANGSGPFNDNTFNTRIDFSPSERLHVFGRYSYAKFDISGAPGFGVAIGGEGFGQGGLAGNSKIKNQSLAAGFDYTVNNHLLTDFRLGYMRYNPQSSKFDSGTTPATDFGLLGFNRGTDDTTGLPGFFMDGNISDFGEALNIGRCNCNLIEREQQIQFVNNWTWIRGNHQFKFGADLRHATNLRIPSDANRAGQLTFSHKGTGQDGVGGLDIATFLFGAPTKLERYFSTSLDAQESQNRYFVYGQDTWRVTPKLTVNYGLRWEIYTPESVNGKGKGGFGNIEDGHIRVAGYGNISNNGNTNNTYKNFAPRLGIAYQVTPKTVVRMGYGRSFDIGVFGSLFGHTVTQNLPVLGNQTLDAGTDQHTAAFFFNDAVVADDLKGPTDPTFPDVPSDGLLPLRGPNNDVTPKTRPTTLRLPTLDAWNVTVQRQLTNTMSLEVGYVGNKGTHTFIGNGPAYNVNTATIVGFGTLTNAERRPFHNKFTYDNYPGLVCCDGDIDYRGNDANNHYNSLQVKLDKRFSDGLQMLAHYTWSHAYYYGDYYGADKSVFFGRDDYNRNHVFILTALYELPFGKGKRFGGNMSRAADYFLGGWQWNTTLNKSSGLPWTPSYKDCGADRDTGPCVPNLAGSFKSGAGDFVYPGGQPYRPFFTPVAELTENGGTNGAFSRPEVGTFGTIQRNSFTGPGFFTSDMSLFKNVNITERVKAQIRFEFFNIFNHPVLALPSNCIDCTDGGQIKGIEFGTTMRQMQFGARFSF